MNKAYRVIWSQVKHCYVVASELAKNHTKNVGRAVYKQSMALLCVAFLCSGYGAVMAADNTAGQGNGVAVGTGSNAPKAENVAIGKNATISYSNGASAATGDVVIGNGARTNNYVSQGGGIALGAGAFSENMAGAQERGFNFNQTTFKGSGFLGMQSPFIPADPTKVATGIAIGQNSYARSGGVMLGTHNYKGDIADTTVDTGSENSMRSHEVSVNATTIGVNSFNNSAFGVVNGAYSAITGAYGGGTGDSKAAQNFGATITGSLNSIESKTASSNYSGVANSIIGVANREFNANGALIFGAGNEITNSVADIYSAPTSGGNSPKKLQQRLMSAIKDAESGGSTMAIGGGNKADYTQKTQITGVNNTVTGTADKIAKLNYVSGFKNTVTNASNNIVMGNDHTVTADNTVAIGGLSGADDRSVANTTSIGYDAKVNQEGGVALGYKSNATVDKGAAGYDPTTGTASTETNSTWKATSAAVSVGDVGNGITRQITSVAAGIADTDAVNVAQLKQAVAGASNRINKLGDRVDRVGAGAAALAALHPQDFDPDDKWDFAAGYGNYKGAHAVAVGAFYRPNEDTTFSVGGSFGGGENMVNVGVSWKLGQKNTISRSRVSIAKDMLAMKNQIEVLTKKLESYESGKPARAVSVSAGAITFPDVPENHWAYAYVKSLADKGYLQGYPDGEFKGDRAMTRYEYAAIIYRALQNGAPSDGTMARSVDEFGPELVKVQNIDRFRVDRISGKDNDRNKVERVRINDKDNAAENDYRDVYGSRIAK